jgi:hypothetical protein
LLVQCRNCGATLQPKDVDQGQCRYCRVALPRAGSRGVEFASLGSLPDLLADKDGDGMPDVVQQMLKARPGQFVEHRVEVNSRTFVQVVHADGRVETLEPAAKADARQQFEIDELMKSVRHQTAAPAQGSRSVLVGLGVALLLTVGVAAFLLVNS